MGFGQDAKQKVLDELMGYLDQKDGDELGSALKPKVDGIEVDAVEGLDGEGPKPEAGEVSPGLGEESPEGVKPELSEEELAELVEALQSQLGQ